MGMPLSRMVQLYPFARECEGTDELVRPVTTLAESAWLGGPDFVDPALRNASSTRPAPDGNASGGSTQQSEEERSGTHSGAGWAPVDDFRIILDTGCCDNIVSWDFADRSARPVRTLPSGQGKTFQGVGAVTLCKAKLEFALDEFEETCEFWVCPNSPALASVGRLCMQQGMSFVWPRNEAPYFVTSWGTVVNLLVLDNIPYLFP